MSKRQFLKEFLQVINLQKVIATTHGKKSAIHYGKLHFLASKKLTLKLFTEAFNSMKFWL